VRNLLWLGFNVPLSLQNTAKDSKRVYPFAVSLDETLRIYQKTLVKLQGVEDVSILVAAHHLSIQELISRGIHLRWDYFLTFDRSGVSVAGQENRHVLYVSDLAKSVTLFQEKTFFASKFTQEVNDLIREVGTCPYEYGVFSCLLQSIQQIVDKLHLESFSNLSTWTSQINDRIEAMLKNRLIAALKEFIKGKIYNIFNPSIEPYYIRHHIYIYTKL
jgi:dynein heavy chain 1